MNTYGNSKRLVAAIRKEVAAPQVELGLQIAAMVKQHRGTGTDEAIISAMTETLVELYGYKPRIVVFVNKIMRIMDSVGE